MENVFKIADKVEHLTDCIIHCTDDNIFTRLFKRYYTRRRNKCINDFINSLMYEFSDHYEYDNIVRTVFCINYLNRLSHNDPNKDKDKNYFYHGYINKKSVIIIIFDMVTDDNELFDKYEYLFTKNISEYKRWKAYYNSNLPTVTKGNKLELKSTENKKLGNVLSDQLRMAFNKYIECLEEELLDYEY